MDQFAIYLPLDMIPRFSRRSPVAVIAEPRHANVVVCYIPQPCVMKNFRLHEDRAANVKASLEVAAMQWKRAEGHPNIHRLLGLCGNYPVPSVVTPYIERSLLEYLLTTQANSVVMFATLQSVATALGYLHDQNPPILHSNVKASNILVDRSGKALLTDIGIHNAVMQSDADSSIRWRAREIVLSVGPSPPTKAADCWSMGMTILEVVSRQRPFAQFPNDAQVIMALYQGHFPLLPPGLDGHLEGLLSSCWKPPLQRLSIQTIAKYLRLLSERARE
ncbi:hypothetical protein NP233_g12445 [Leucocoprinus birnbaumii]|uniref:Protein kinase domain-containing protein n=1 Tax=Leucocoprinus birnbaumii TaxID=56174 RepID=A0AAD5YKF4_9AGAR|nr:hypothetical protein NP233_g12445 [Leucocoprinus birnbaumii]